MKKILVIGSGGREHAIAWKLSQSSQVSAIYVAPGNAGTARECKTENIAIQATDTPALLTFAHEQQIDLTIVGPEAPLVQGLVNIFTQAGFPCLGPDKAAAQLEGSKAFCKAFLKKYQIPTADYARFTDVAEALRYIEDKNFPLVIKADGLAAGKGVVIARNTEEAQEAIHAMLVGHKFGAASQTIIIEEYLHGEEASFIILTDGKTIVPMANSQDHKARDDGDRGPNTGGMGAYSPAPLITPAIHQHIMQDIIKPTIQGLTAEGITYQGFLYAGLMIDTQGKAKVLEFNCRLGDPETQPIMMRLSSDFYQLAAACVQQKLHQHSVQWSSQTALGVVMASGGYPDPYQTGHVITGLATVATTASVKVFHAGTRINAENQVMTDGGRVLCVTGLGDKITDAQRKVYTASKKIHWHGCFYRHDIGNKAI